MADILLNTANTLSTKTSPGEDKRFPSVSTESIFSWGDYRIQRNNTTQALENYKSGGTGFSSYSDLSGLSLEETFDPIKIVNTTVNDLNPKLEDPQSYAYFGSFYTKVATAMNNIIENYPYAMISYAGGSGVSLYNYTNDNLENQCEFSIPMSAITNPGGVIFASGLTENDQISLYRDYDQFGIQLSGFSDVHTIVDYTYTTGPTGIMRFVLSGKLYSADTVATSTDKVYIRPSHGRFNEYKKTISNLEYQLLYDGYFLVPDPDTDLFERTLFEWPRTDGFNIDTSGTDFETYDEALMESCRAVDESKTNWMVRTMVPETYLDLDSGGEIYRKLLTVYADEFDKVKQYIDSLAFAHTVTYDNQENIPNKFVHKFAKLLGFKLSNAFNETSLFAYLTNEEDDDDGKSMSDFNMELWKRILININWLYKKKGTRDAIQFIFKIIGAPDSFVNFNEFTYRIRKVVTNDAGGEGSVKINDEGYIDYNASAYIFQEGGKGAGNGDAYIRQWTPEFDPAPEINNEKVVVGDEDVNGSEDIINSKEVTIELTPAKAIESDVKEWYELDAVRTSLNTGLTGSTPYEISNLLLASPTNITGMTLSQWVDYVYQNNVDPRNHKTVGKELGHTANYISLKRVYLTYMYWNSGVPSNRLKFHSLESFLDLLERNFADYIPQLVPATTIFDPSGIMYKNTVFNRAKFVYPEGISAGSEFKKRYETQPDLIFNPVLTTLKVVENINPQIQVIQSRVEMHNNLREVINTMNVTVTTSNRLQPSISPVAINPTVGNVTPLTFNALNVSFTVKTPDFSAKSTNNVKHNTTLMTIINFPTT